MHLTETKVYFFKDNQLRQGLVKAVMRLNLNGINTTAYFVLDPKSAHLQECILGEPHKPKYHRDPFKTLLGLYTEHREWFFTDDELFLDVDKALQSLKDCFLAEKEILTRSHIQPHNP